MCVSPRQFFYACHCREHETQYLVRTLVQNLRVGAGWRSVVPALARASVMAREGTHVSKQRLEQAANAGVAAFHLCPSLDVLVPALLEEGVDSLEQRCSLTPGEDSGACHCMV